MNKKIHKQNDMSANMEDIFRIVSYFKNLIGLTKVELGAMEPLLWSSKGKTIADLVGELILSGYFVAITTNGTLLHKHIDGLQQAGLNLLRISWPSFFSKRFEEITAQPYKSFLKGIEKLLNCNIVFKFNRLLIKGFLDDIHDHINWIRDKNCIIKLHDLYWTKEVSNVYKKYYISPDNVINNYISDLIIKVEKINSHGRNRNIYYLSDHAKIEVKKAPIKNHPICIKCNYNKVCLEGFMEYIRIRTDMAMIPCYLRNDLVIYLDTDHDILPAINKKWLITYDNIKSAKLRLTITNSCNHKCMFPNTNIAWCLRKEEKNKHKPNLYKNYTKELIK